MPRPDWDITRLELAKTFYPDPTLTTLVETLTVRHTMIYRVTRQTKVFEMTYTTPTDNDLVRQENLWIQRLELSAQVPLVPMGPIDTKDPVPIPELQRARRLTEALRLIDAARLTLDSLDTAESTLSAAFPDASVLIEQTLGPARADARARYGQALDLLKLIEADA